MYDIGAVLPAGDPALLRLFEAAGFEDDREGSTTMTFTSHHTWVSGGQPAAPQPHQHEQHSSAALDAGLALGPEVLYSQPRMTRGPRGDVLLPVVPVDLLEGVPAPATRELRSSEAMRRQLLRKLDNVCGAQREHGCTILPGHGMRIK
jgi:hypothetical protein